MYTSFTYLFLIFLNPTINFSRDSVCPCIYRSLYSSNCLRFQIVCRRLLMILYIICMCMSENDIAQISPKSSSFTIDYIATYVQFLFLLQIQLLIIFTHALSLYVFVYVTEAYIYIIIFAKKRV